MTGNRFQTESGFYDPFRSREPSRFVRPLPYTSFWNCA